MLDELLVSCPACREVIEAVEVIRELGEVDGSPAYVVSCHQCGEDIGLLQMYKVLTSDNNSS